MKDKVYCCNCIHGDKTFSIPSCEYIIQKEERNKYTGAIEKYLKVLNTTSNIEGTCPYYKEGRLGVIFKNWFKRKFKIDNKRNIK